MPAWKPVKGKEKVLLHLVAIHVLALVGTYPVSTSKHSCIRRGLDLQSSWRFGHDGLQSPIPGAPHAQTQQGRRTFPRLLDGLQWLGFARALGRKSPAPPREIGHPGGRFESGARRVLVGAPALALSDDSGRYQAMGSGPRQSRNTVSGDTPRHRSSCSRFSAGSHSDGKRSSG